jgi:hypothetical protein
MLVINQYLEETQNIITRQLFKYNLMYFHTEYFISR